jgi:flagellar protein FliO/FliZ
MKRSAALVAAVLLVVSPAFAQPDTEAPALTGGLLQATLGLALVLAMILAVAWAAKRLAPGTLRGTGVPLTIVASQSVGQRERVVVVEVADQWLVLGVAPGRVSALSTLPKGTLPTPSPSAATPFAAALSRALGRRQ